MRRSPADRPDMQEALPWIIALAVLVVAAAAMASWVTRARPADAAPLPSQWAVAPRTVFTVDERRTYRQLREAFPQHIVLAKLPLVRFCQPADADEMHYWFELLGSIHVSFAICTTQGRVLAAVDLEGDRPPSRRSLQIKQNVLGACRIRYLRCAIDQLPSVTELQTLLPPAAAAAAPEAAAPPAAPSAAARPPAVDSAPLPMIRPAPAAPPQQQVVHDVASAPVARARRERKPLWQDSGLFQDSFFGIDNLRDAGPQGPAAAQLGEALRGAAPSAPPAGDTVPGMLESELRPPKPSSAR